MKRFVKEYAAHIKKAITHYQKMNCLKNRFADFSFFYDLEERLNKILFYCEKGMITCDEAMEELCKIHKEERSYYHD